MKSKGQSSVIKIALVYHVNFCCKISIHDQENLHGD